jgi:hypothetical protein
VVILLILLGFALLLMESETHLSGFKKGIPLVCCEQGQLILFVDRYAENLPPIYIIENGVDVPGENNMTLAEVGKKVDEFT